MKLTVRAHAKINWSLAICGERPDGYHDLDMLMQPIALCDEITFETAKWITLTVQGRRLPNDGRNLIVRAAAALNDALGLRMGARITLKKCIPSRAGLGGGSADCAAALVALNRMWNLRLPMHTLMAIGLKLGADVPFCLQNGFARAEGVGEILTPFDPAPEVPIAMVTPDGGLSTPQVFRAWNEGRYPMRPIDNIALRDALTRGDFRAAQAISRNDLEPPAIRLMPKIGEIMDQFRQLGASYVRMSGSGSTVYAVFDTDEAARHAASQIPEAIATRTMAGRR